MTLRNFTDEQATDNVGIDKVTSTADWKSTFKLGDTKVTFKATDLTGLSSQCSFNVHIRKITYGGLQTGFCGLLKGSWSNIENK